MKGDRARWMAILAAIFAVAVAAASAQQKGAKEHAFKGKVEQVDQKAKTVTVAGEAVEGWMGAMTMVYKFDKDDVLKAVKSGDQITAKVYDGDFQVLHDVKILPPAPKK
jgi:Cu/Ag efflux protein CusF